MSLEEILENDKPERPGTIIPGLSGLIFNESHQKTND